MFETGKHVVPLIVGFGALLSIGLTDCETTPQALPVFDRPQVADDALPLEIQNSAASMDVDEGTSRLLATLMALPYDPSASDTGEWIGDYVHVEPPGQR
jgi:hypothetical protein